MACMRCKEEHPIIECPYVKAVEFEDCELTPDSPHPGRIIRRVEFLTPADYGPRAAALAEPAPHEDYPRMGAPKQG